MPTRTRPAWEDGQAVGIAEADRRRTVSRLGESTGPHDGSVVLLGRHRVRVAREQGRDENKGASLSGI